MSHKASARLVAVNIRVNSNSRSSFIPPPPGVTGIKKRKEGKRDRGIKGELVKVKPKSERESRIKWKLYQVELHVLFLKSEIQQFN